MSGLVDNHPLARDLPALKDAIHDLKMNDAHFAKELETYETLDKEIVRIEQGIELRSEDELETMKRQRVQLKDELNGIATKHAQSET